MAYQSMKYRALDTSAKEIRLLHFTGKKPFESGTPLSCSLKTVQLAQLGSSVYSAISYCWGDSSVRKDIFIDGRRMTIPATAEQALRHLHLRAFRSNDWREEQNDDDIIIADLIWIDSVCINQADLTERSSQVEIMSEIYSQAGQVLVWLGEDDFNSTPEFDRSIDILLEQCRSQVDHFRQVPNLYEAALESKSRPSGRRYFTDSKDLRLSHGVSWRSLRLFFGAPWFSRLWIVQEVLLAERAHLCKGSYTRNFMSVGISCLLLRLLDYERTAHPRIPGIDLTSSITEIRNRICTNHSGDCVPGRNCGEINIHYVLRAFSMRQTTTEPRDIVYAILGSIEKEVARGLVPVDYRIPLPSLFQRVTVTAMRSRASLSLLANARKDEWDFDDCRTLQWFKDTGWPTWVPLYHERTSTSHQVRFPLAFYRANDSIRAHFIGDQHALPENTLECFGQLVGCVKSTTVVFTRQPRDWHYDDTCGCVSQCWELISSSTRYTDPGSRASATCLTLLAGIGPDGRLMNDNDTLNTSFLATVQRLCQSSSSRNIESHNDDVDATSFTYHHTSEAASTTTSIADCDSTGSVVCTGSSTDEDGDNSGNEAQFLPNNVAGLMTVNDHETASYLSRSHDEGPDYQAPAGIDEMGLSRTGDSANPFFDTYMPTAEDIDTRDATVDTTEDDRLTLSRMQNAFYEPWQLERSLATFPEGRRFFETDSGHIGIGPSDTTVGDQIVIFYGHEMPVVLRACEDEAFSYYIGACYVQDIMQVTSSYIAVAAVFIPAVSY